MRAFQKHPSNYSMFPQILGVGLAFFKFLCAVKKICVIFFLDHIFIFIQFIPEHLVEFKLEFLACAIKYQKKLQMSHFTSSASSLP